MKTIYLLCEWGDDWHEWRVLGWHADKEVLEAEALRRCWDDYNQDQAERAAGVVKGYTKLSPDETDYRRFFVRSVVPM
jgi:hypothetical protein